MVPRHLALALAAVLAAGRAAPAQEAGSDGAGRSTLEGVYTDGQARKGESGYARYCIECHTPVAYTGTAFRRVWSGRSVFELYDLIRTTMPNDRPGRLSRGQYAEIVAYLLQLNRLPPGDKALPSNDDALKRIRIETPPPPPPPTASPPSQGAPP